MNLKIFQSNKGDCLLLEADSGELVLCDGGMAASMRKHVREELSDLRQNGRELEFIYISHVDNDHISGVLQLLEDEAEWRVYDLHQQNGDPIKKPKVPRPPVIKGILHNAFRDMITQNQKPIESLFAAKEMENLLSAMSPQLFGTAVPDLVNAAAEMQSIAAGIPEAIQVSKLIAPEALDIPLNNPLGTAGPSRLLYSGAPGDKFQVGSMKFTLIGPTTKELSDLRDGWNNWLRDNQAQLKTLRATLKKKIDEFSTGALANSPFDLRDWAGIPDYKGVTAPNIASIMFLVEENGKRLLLTGDGQQDFILAGLKREGFLKKGYVHIDVLKVQHHGSEHNLDEDFARKVSADHYVFCGNGENDNPELSVINIIYNSRLGKSSVRTLAPEAANREFHFWFSTTSDAQEDTAKSKVYFRKMEKEVEKLAQQSGGLLTLHFNQDASITLNI